VIEKSLSVFAYWFSLLVLPPLRNLREIFFVMQFSVSFERNERVKNTANVIRTLCVEKYHVK
jgi:hypothetical protein